MTYAEKSSTKIETVGMRRKLFFEKAETKLRAYEDKNRKPQPIGTELQGPKTA